MASLEAIDDINIGYHDSVSVSKGSTRLLRHGVYASLQGTMLTLDEKPHILYTRGSVDFYQTFPSLYIPNPRLIRCDETAYTICNAGEEQCFVCPILHLHLAGCHAEVLSQRSE